MPDEKPQQAGETDQEPEETYIDALTVGLRHSTTDGTQKQMVYDARGNKSIDYDENFNATLYQYDALNRLVTQARHMSGSDPKGLLNAVGDITSIPSGDIATYYSYNNANSKVSVTDPNGGVTTMHYDDLQRTTDIYTSPDGSLQYHTHFDYGANSGGNCFDSASFKPTHTVDPRGITTDVSYDALYRPLSKTVTYDSSGDTSTVTTKYDAVGNVVLVIDPSHKQNQTITTYDALNRPLVTTCADGSTTRQDYTSTGFKWRAQQQVSGTGTGTVFETTQSQYDAGGRVVAVTAGVGTSAAATTRTIYDAAGNVAATIDPLGQEWDYSYDACNRKLQEFEPGVADAANGNTTTNPTLTWRYDPAGRVAATIDARQNETDMTYDAANRVTDVTEPVVPLGTGTARPHTHTDYDFNGNPVYVYNANDVVAAGGTFGGNGPCVTNTYDALNRLLTTTDEAGNVVRNTYDAVGNKLTVEDGNTNVTTFSYDGLNRLVTTTDAENNVTKLGYDGLNKVSRTDAMGQVTYYHYDDRNRLDMMFYESSLAANCQRNYTYDEVGNLLSVTEPAKNGAADVAYGYDALNRVVSEMSSGITHGYTYDLAGNRLTTVYGGTSRSIISTYDALNRLSTMTENGRVTTYGYDLNGNIVLKTAPNGDTETYAFDALNRAASEVAATGPSGGTSLYSFGYGYDLVGNVLTVNETYSSGLGSRTVTNTYDAINRLHIESVDPNPSGGIITNVTTTYDYDSANNRLDKIVVAAGTTVTTNYSYNNLNQLTGYTDGSRAVALGYDNNGNRATRTVSGGSDNGTDTYSYDFENRLIGLVKGTAGGAGTYAYTYDYRTRRVTRDESANAGGTLTRLVFSGGTSVQEYDGANTTPAVEYIRGSDYGGGVGGILYTLRCGIPGYTHENRRGDVVAKTDATGSLTYQAQYEAFGNQTATNGSTLDRQKSNSKDTDPTGLVDEGFRYRDLETGEFITRDPAGFIDGPNLYTYVRQNPWSSYDPEGLWGVGEFVQDYQHQMVTNSVGVGRGIFNAAYGLGQTIGNGSVGLANMAANAAKSVVNGQLADACTSLRQNSGNIGAAVYQDTIGAAGTAITNVGKNIVATAGKNGGGGELCGDIVAAVVTGKICGAPEDTPGGTTAKETCASPTTCFTAGTLVLEDGGEMPIETIHVGDRVLSNDARHQESITEVNTSNWKDFKLRVENEDNSHDPLTVEALRSPAWIKASGARLGSRIWFEAEDVGVNGWAMVEDVKPCPPIKPGKGRVVLTTFTHFNNDLYRLQVSNLKQAIEVTGRHRIYSATRHDWVRTRDLKIREELKTRDGERAVIGIRHEGGAQRVYNLEVETDHCYFVSDARVLVHNDCGDASESEELIPVYRGVASDHFRYQDALEGKANPIGGDSTPKEHNAGDTRSEFTSWTISRFVAHNEFATRSTEDKFTRTHGVILEDEVPMSQLIISPDRHEEFEVLRRGPITGAKVHLVPNPDTE